MEKENLQSCFSAVNSPGTAVGVAAAVQCQGLGSTWEVQTEGPQRPGTPETFPSQAFEPHS